MNGNGYKSKIKVNDTVILFDSDGTEVVQADPSEVISCRHGFFKHCNMLGKAYGGQLWSHKGKTFKWLFHPTPELWTQSLTHRTQILYTPDIALVTTLLDLVPGKIVCESGTGSGSLSHAIARTIAPHGTLYTFDFHAERVSLVEKEFIDHGLSSVINVQCRDVCKNGFGLDSCVEAIFLDLPKPWEVIPHCQIAFKGGSENRLVSFSPCIEQVQQTHQALEIAGFTDIQMHECLSQSLYPKTVSIQEPMLDAGVNTFIKSKESELATIIPKRTMAGHTGYLLSCSFLKF